MAFYQLEAEMEATEQGGKEQGKATQSEKQKVSAPEEAQEMELLVSWKEMVWKRKQKGWLESFLKKQSESYFIPYTKINSTLIN